MVGLMELQTFHTWDSQNTLLCGTATCQLLNVHGINDVWQTEIYTAEALVLKASIFGFEIGIQNFWRYNSRLFTKFSQKCFKKLEKYLARSIHLSITYRITLNCLNREGPSSSLGTTTLQVLAWSTIPFYAYLSIAILVQFWNFTFPGSVLTSASHINLSLPFLLTVYGLHSLFSSLPFLYPSLQHTQLILFSVLLYICMFD